MKYKFYTTSKKAWTGMLEAMKEAETSIFIEMYIMVDDTKKFDFIKILKEKALGGLKVILVLDYFGSFSLSRGAISELKSAGAEVLFFSHFLHRTHRKITIIDGKTVFLGGVNIHHSAKDWVDLALEIRGTFVKNLSRSFAKTYFASGGKDESLKVLLEAPFLGKLKMWFIEHIPAYKRIELKTYYKERILSAENSIKISTPYFIPNRWFLASLDQAVIRGVSVEVFVPAHTDYWLVDRANYFYIFKMAKTGVKFFLFNRMNHAKAMLIDGKEGMIGSQNMDALSFDRNSESGVFFRNKDMVKELSGIMDDWKKSSILFDYKNRKPKWFDFMLAPFIRFFQPIL